MSDQQVAFENWQDAAQQANNEAQKIEQTQVTKTDQDAQKELNQIKPSEAKQTLKQKIAEYNEMLPEQFQAKYAQNGQANRKPIKLGVGKVLKNDADFSQLAKQIADKLSDGIGPQETLDDQAITTFIQQLILYIYDGLDFENLFDLSKKFKSIKTARKAIEKQLQKQKQKKKNQNKAEQQSISSSKNLQKLDKTPKDDLFGGATMVNSKQQQEQRKKIAAEKKVQQKIEQQKKAPPPADDDDFM